MPEIFLKICASLFVILLLSRFLKGLVMPLCAGIICLIFLIGYSLGEVFANFANRIFNVNTFFLVLVFLEIMWFSRQMEFSKTTKTLVESAMGLFRGKNALAVLPAIIGLLPMPGGALFSAPLVDKCDEEKQIDPTRKTLINYWFRHVWEYWWPLYPGVLLAIELSGLATWQFIMIQIPMCVFAIGTGYFFLLRKIQINPVNSPHPDKMNHAKKLFYVILPIIIVIAAYLTIKIFFPQLARFNKYLPMALALPIAMTALQIKSPISRADWGRIILDKTIYPTLLAVCLVLVYGGFIEGKLPDGTLLVEKIRVEISSLGIPSLLLFIFIPFICGMTTGLAIGFVGASFPIVIGLLGENPDLKIAAPTVLLAFGFGYMGMILSPVHICLIVSNKHFQTQLLHSLKGLFAPCAVMLFLNFSFYLLLRYLLKLII